jgi:hypothetical protein
VCVLLLCSIPTHQRSRRRNWLTRRHSPCLKSTTGQCSFSIGKSKAFSLLQRPPPSPVATAGVCCTVTKSAFISFPFDSVCLPRTNHNGIRGEINVPQVKSSVHCRPVPPCYNNPAPHIKDRCTGRYRPQAYKDGVMTSASHT